MRFFLLTCVLVSTGPYAFSQVSPVQIVPAVFAPYSTLLSEYYSGTSTRLSVTLINTDFNEPLLKVYMRMTIEGQGVKLQSNVYGNYPILELTPGLPVVVSQSDLAPYFSAQNLQVAASAGGLRPQVRLPEGYYQFSFEAFEVNTGRIVGNKQSAQAYLTLSDPPFLTMPEKGVIVPAANPFNLLFQWTPRHLSNPNAFNTEYTFDLVEIWDEGIAPEAAFYTSKPIYSTTLTTTNLFYGPGEPPLIVGKRYAWRVQSTLVTDNNDQEPFRNNGYSEIYWFKLQSDCPLIQRADIVSDPHTNKTSMSWTPDFSSIGGFKMDYRKKGSTTWTTVDAPFNTTTLTGLSWNTEYEYRLANRCVITDEFAYGGLQSFRTLNQDTTKCVPSQPKAITNTEPLAKLQPGDTIYASGFQMRLTKVTGSNGQFSGEGYLGLLIPTTTTEVSVKASFHNISVNTDKELFAGKIVSIYDRNEGGIANVDEFFEGGQGEGSTKTGATAAIAVNTIVDPSKKAIISTSASSSGETTYEVMVTGTDGKPVTFQAKKLPVVIQDKSGKIYIIDKDGTIKNAGAGGATQQQILAGKGPEALNLLNADKGTVTFEAHADQTYALDTYQLAYNTSALFSQKYESLVQGRYRVANKLLVANSIDKIQATISNLDAAIPADSIHFITGKGIEFSAVKLSSTTFEITLLSGPESDAQELYAVYRDSKAAGANTDPTIESSSFTYSLGKLNIATYAAKQLKVTLVPVGTATIDEQQVQQKLNEVYNKVGVSWTVSKAAPFTDLSWDANKDGRLDVKDAGKNNTYSAEMQALNDAYARTGIDAATPYLFIFNTSPLNNDQTLKGDMLRNKQFGYLFTPLTDAGTVAAHELAHGMFHLNHTFDTQYKFKEGDLADNLMDYRGGSNLVKLQWDAIHAPGLVIGVFEKEGDSQTIIYRDNLPEAMWNTNKTSCSFITPGGSQITLPNTVYGTTYMFGIPGFFTDEMRVVTGTLMEFYLPTDDENGQRYKAYIDNGSFNGYYKANDNGNINLSAKFDDILLVNGYENKIIVAYPLPDGWRLEKLEVQNLLISYKDVTTNVDVVSEITTPVIINKNTTKFLSLNCGFSTNNTGIKQTRFNPAYKNMLMTHETGSELLAVLKIVQLKTMYPVLFNNFCNDYDDWNDSPNILGTLEIWDKKVEETPALYNKWKTDQEAFYLEMIDEFWLYSSDQYTSKFTNFYKSLTQNESGFDQVLLVTTLPLFSDDEIGSLTIIDRIKAIGLLAINAPNSNTAIEEQIIRLVKLTPSNDCNEFLTKIQLNNPMIEENKIKFPERSIVSKILLYQLIDGFGTGGIPFNDDGKYDDLLKAFINVCNRSQVFYDASMAKDADLANFDKNVIVYRYSSIWTVSRNAVFGSESIELGFDCMNYETDVTLVSNPPSINLNVKQENCINGFANCNTDDLGTFNVFEPVWLSQNGSLTILSDAIGIQGAWIPAFALKYAYDKGNQQTTSDIVNAAIDGAGLFTGLTELRAGVKGLKMAIALSDVLASSVGLVDNATNSQITRNYPNFAACVTTMDVLSGAIGLKQALTNGLSSSNNKLQSTYAITKNLTNNNSANIIQYTNNYLASVETAAAETMKWSNLPTDVRIKHIKFTEYLAVQANLAGNTSIVNRAKAVLVKMRNSFSALYTKYMTIDLKLNQTTGDLLNSAGTKVATIDNSVLKLESNVNVSTTVTATDANSVSVDGVTSIEVGGTAFGVTNPKLVKTPTGYTCLGDGAYCFVAGTPVLISAGKQIPIEQVSIKNIISAYDHELKANVMGRVTRTFSKTTNQLIKLIIGGALLWTTVDHPLYANDRYTPAKELHVGDSILSFDGKKQVVEFIKLVDTSATVYNIEVSDYNNYYAGKNALLVHNSCSFLTVKNNISIASDWTTFQSNLISSAIPAADRLAMYNKLAAMNVTDLNVWVKNFNDPKVLAEIKRIYGDPNVLSKYPTLFNDLSSDTYKMLVFKEVTNDPVIVYEKLSQGLYSSLIDTWLRDKMWSYVRSGKDFEDAIGGMIDTRNALIMGKLETALGLPSGGLNNFTSVDQLQINVGSTYFVADRALIKELPDRTFEVYILEMKITSNTSLTSNQTSFITSYNNGSKNLTTRSTNKSTIIKQGSTINVLGAKKIIGPVDNYSITNYQ